MLADTGIVALTVNGGTVATAPYGATSTPSSIAEALAANASSSPVKVTAVDDALYIEATGTGSQTNYPYSILNTSYSSSVFSQPSFPVSTISGVLDGGANSVPSGQTQTVYQYSVGYDPVGNLAAYTDTVMGTWSYANGYDTLNRLVAAKNTAASGASPQYANNYGCWSYDPFGNRTIEAVSTTACANNPTPGSWAHYNGNNQFTSTSQATGGVSYDPAGDVTYDGVNQYLYDGDGRICAVAQYVSVLGTYTYTGYLYDAEGTRVAKGSLTAWSCDPALNGFQTTNDYVLGPGGEQAAEMGVDVKSGSASTLVWQHTNVWAVGELIATYDNDGLHFYFNDPLGTRRAQTDSAGNLEQTCSSLPFGDGLNCSNSTQYSTEHHFTGKERDTESGNDYFGARYYASTMGRWLSPDRPGYQQKEDPQSMNLYAYVRNNPLVRTDPTGNYDLGIDCKSNPKGCFDMNMAAFMLRQASFDPSMSNLGKISDALGTNGDHNGVVITLGAFKAGTQGFIEGAETSFTGAGPSGNGFTIKFNSALEWNVNTLAAGLAHEGTHGVWAQTRNSMNSSFLDRAISAFSGYKPPSKLSFDGVEAEERAAYRNQGFMEQNLHVKGVIYDPTQTADQREQNIYRMARASANGDCATNADGSSPCE